MTSARCLLLAVVAALAACGPEPPPDTGPPSVVLISVDTLRADHLPSYGYPRDTAPAVARLAADALVFENAIAPMATTLPSHTSLLTSTYPVRHGVLSNFRFYEQPAMTHDAIESVATKLARAGYATAAFTSASPLSELSGIGTGFEVFRGPPPYGERRERIEVPAKETIDRALAWLEDARPPFFLMVHLFDPHTPYAPPAGEAGRLGDEDRLREVVESRGVPPHARGQAIEAMALYDGEVRYVDAQIGRLLEALEARGLYRRSAIVFTADHGEGLLQHGVLEHGVIWNEQLHVPLVIRLPARPDRPTPTGRRAGIASLIDVFPTLAEEAPLPIATAGFDGINLLRASRETALAQREIRSPVWLGRNFALVGRDWKYLWFEQARDQLYHLREDPHELEDVLHRHPHVAERMREELRALVREQEARAPLPAKESIPEAVRKQLEALGYVE